MRSVFMFSNRAQYGWVATYSSFPPKCRSCGCPHSAASIPPCSGYAPTAVRSTHKRPHSPPPHAQSHTHRPARGVVRDPVGKDLQALPDRCLRLPLQQGLRLRNVRVGGDGPAHWVVLREGHCVVVAVDREGVVDERADAQLQPRLGATWRAFRSYLGFLYRNLIFLRRPFLDDARAIRTNPRTMFPIDRRRGT